MNKHHEKYQQAEQAFLESEGIHGEPQMVNLQRLGSTLRVVIAGEGPPVLFVPGTMSTGVAFANLVKNMPDYQCIMIDRPGTGLSPNLPGPPKDYESQAAAADEILADLLDGLGIEQSHIVATSLGGWTTFRSVAAHPERFQRIVGLAWLMGAPVTGMPLPMRMPAPTSLIPARLPARPWIVKASLKSGGMGKAIKAGKFSDEMIEYMAALMRHTPTFQSDTRYSPRPFGPMGAIERTRHSAELLAKVTHPVHLFWGTEDLFGNAESAREFASLLPNAQLQMVEGAEHAPWFDEPDLAAAAVRGHLSSQVPAG